MLIGKHWLIQVQHNSKYLFRIALVGQYLWAEIASWRTKKGAQDNGWLTMKPGRFKIVTPLASLAACVAVGKQ